MRGLCHGYFSIIDCIWMAKNLEGWNHLKYRTSIWNCISWPFHVRNLLLTAPKSLPLMPGRGHLQVASIGVKVSPTKYPFLIFSGSFFSALFKIRATLHCTGWLIETLVAAWHYSYIIEESKTKQSGFCCGPCVAAIHTVHVPSTLAGSWQTTWKQLNQKENGTR